MTERKIWRTELFYVLWYQLIFVGNNCFHEEFAKIWSNIIHIFNFQLIYRSRWEKEK